MTSIPDKPRYVDADTPANIVRDRQPIPLPEGQPGDDGSDPAPESDMESGLLKPLDNTPTVRNPNAGPADNADRRGQQSRSAPLGTKANTGVHPTTEVPDEPQRKTD